LISIDAFGKRNAIDQPLEPLFRARFDFPPSLLLAAKFCGRNRVRDRLGNYLGARSDKSGLMSEGRPASAGAMGIRRKSAQHRMLAGSSMPKRIEK
jgi:hypothetical protein